MILSLPSLGIKGINTDIVPWKLPPEFISRGINFRCKAAGIRSFGGSSLVATPPTDYKPGYGITVNTLDGAFVVSPGTDIIYSYNAGSYTDITGTDTMLSPGQEYAWTGCLNGAVVFLANEFNFPRYWIGTGDCVDLPWNIDNDANITTWKDQGVRCKVLRSHKNFLWNNRAIPYWPYHD